MNAIRARICCRSRVRLWSSPGGGRECQTIEGDYQFRLIACALGNQVCSQGLSVRYLRLPALLEQLCIVHGDGSYVRLMGQLLKTDLLILDNWGIQPLTRSQRNDLMEVIEDRHDRRSTPTASQLPVDHWHDYISTRPPPADAILGWPLHDAHRLNLSGESVRQKNRPDAKIRVYMGSIGGAGD